VRSRERAAIQRGREHKSTGIANIRSRYMERPSHANKIKIAIEIDMEFTDVGETAISNAKKLAELKRERGKQLFIIKQYQQAIQLYTEAIELCPDSSV
jgi:tetratricopeptide (TPR) repeat protein